MLSADRTIDYSARLGEITTPTLLVAGDGDIMSDVRSTELTFAALGSPDKAIMRFGKSQGHVADYGHCDLVWSRHAPAEIFPPIIDWLDQRQPGAGPSPQAVSTLNGGAISVSEAVSRSGARQPFRNESTQICDQVSNSPRMSQTVDNGRNSAFGQAFFPRHNARVLELEEVDDAEVNLPNGSGVVIDEPDPANTAGGLDLDFLVEFAPHGRLISLEALSPFSVFFRDVAADAERSQAMQPRLALRLAARVAKHSVAAPEYDVGDDLLEARIVFDPRAGQELNQLGHEQAAHVTIGLRGKALEPAEAIELGAGNHQDAFVEFGAHQRSRGG